MQTLQPLIHAQGPVKQPVLPGCFSERPHHRHQLLSSRAPGCSPPGPQARREECWSCARRAVSAQFRAVVQWAKSESADGQRCKPERWAIAFRSKHKPCGRGRAMSWQGRRKSFVPAISSRSSGSSLRRGGRPERGLEPVPPFLWPAHLCQYRCWSSGSRRGLHRRQLRVPRLGGSTADCDSRG